MYRDPILTILAELRLLLTAREDEIAILRSRISQTNAKNTELESKLMTLGENLMKDTVNG